MNRFFLRSNLAEASSEADDATLLRAAALLPGQLLHGGEVIILLVKPSPWYIVLESLRFLAGTLLVTVIALEISGRGYIQIGRVDLVLLAIGATGVRFVWQFLEWLSRVYVLTDRRIIVVSGVLRVQVFETQLKKIQHTVTLFSLRERLFALGTIGFATAGTGQIEATWRMIAKPLDVHSIVIQTLNRYR